MPPIRQQFRQQRRGLFLLLSFGLFGVCLLASLACFLTRPPDQKAAEALALYYAAEQALAAHGTHGQPSSLSTLRFSAELALESAIKHTPHKARLWDAYATLKLQPYKTTQTHHQSFSFRPLSVSAIFSPMRKFSVQGDDNHDRSF